MLFADRPAVPDLDEVRAHLETGEDYQVQFGMRVQNRIDIFELNGSDLALKETIGSVDYLSGLNRLCREYGPRLEVRFYGHYSDIFDGDILTHLPDVACLTLNCLEQAKNLRRLADLSNLEDLSLGVFELDDKDVLTHIPLDRLSALCLEESQTKALDLAPLAGASALKSLKLYGHKKNIRVISDLTALEEFVFNPAKNMDLEFINGLRGLKALKFVLGGITDFSDVALPELRQLAVTRVRGLETLGDLTRFPKLEQMIVQDQIRLAEISFNDGSSALAHILIDNCKTLAALPGLDQLPVLESLSIGQTELEIDKLDLPQSLTHISAHVGTVSGNRTAQDKIIARGLIPEMHPDMPFFYK